MPDDALRDFERTSFAHDGKERAVFRKGTGPAVIVISEIPGITPAVAGFARRVSDRGLTAVMPHVFGVPGKEPSLSYALQSIGWGCVSKEFTAMATGRTSQI